MRRMPDRIQSDGSLQPGFIPARQVDASDGATSWILVWNDASFGVDHWTHLDPLWLEDGFLAPGPLQIR